jgi:hypothetical protein
MPKRDASKPVGNAVGNRILDLLNSGCVVVVVGFLEKREIANKARSARWNAVVISAVRASAHPRRCVIEALMTS